MSFTFTSSCKTMGLACQEQWNWQIIFDISLPFWGWHTKIKPKYFVYVHMPFSKTGNFACQGISEFGRLFSACLYPFEDDITKTKPKYFVNVHISFSKTGSFACQDTNESGRLFLVFLYPFEDDILKQTQNIW